MHLVPFQNHDGIVHYPLWIFFARTVDRFEKSNRNKQRPSSDEATHETKENIWFSSFHGHMGAVLGPSLAAALYFYPENYINLFYIAFIPGLLAIATFGKKKEQLTDKKITPSSRFELLEVSPPVPKVIGL
jgi:MFS family permease